MKDSQIHHVSFTSISKKCFLLFKMKNTFVWIFIAFSMDMATGCVFDARFGGLDEGFGATQFYEHDRPTLEEKTEALLTQFPELANNPSQLSSMLGLSAGPYNISNVNTNPNSGKSYNYKVQGDDWPQTFASCGGDRQTPININKAETKQATLPPLKFSGYNNIHPQMDIVNNAHTVDVNGPWGQDGVDVPTMSGGPLNGSYKLHGVHFHWGYDKSDGSEHLINSKSSALEMHMVHYKAEYKNVMEAINANLPDSLAVVGFLFNPGFITSAETASMFKTLDDANKGQIVFPAAMPLDVVKSIKSYYTYDGSLTTPTCNEIVRWILVDNPNFQIKQSDLDVMAKYLENGKPIIGNFRTPQNLNNRKVFNVKAGNSLSPFDRPQLF